jgi:spore coat-associated protein N
MEEPVARIAFLIKQPKRALGALAVLVAATGVVAGSGANFTAQSANPNNSFSAGTLSILNDKENAAILTTGTTGMKPGGASAVGVVDIQNDGSLAGNFELSRSNVTNTDATYPMSAKLNLVVKDCGEWSGPSTVEACGAAGSVADVTVYTGTIDGMGTVNLGNFGGGEKHRYEFSVQLDASATDDYQGDSSTVRFDWDAVQS